MNKTIFVCQNTIEGIFSAIYDAYSSVCNHEIEHANVEICSQGIENYCMFANYINVETDSDKAIKVSRTICNKMGYEAYECFCFAISCDDNDKATNIYHSIVTGLHISNPFRIMNMWTNSNVARVIELSRQGRNEFFRWREFLQFRELSSGILYSKIGPTCDIIAFLGPHFENRLPNENFIIHDSIRDRFLIHEKQKNWVLISGNDFHGDRTLLNTLSEKEEIISDLFRAFTTSIAIKERINPKLQQQLMPLRIQKYKIEF